MYVVIVLPFKYSFVEHEYLWWEILDYIMDSLFAMDIVFQFFTAYMGHEDVLISSLKKIACNYLSFWFWVDAISVLPIGLLI